MMTKQKMSSGAVQRVHAPAKKLRGIALAMLALLALCLVFAAPAAAEDTDIIKVGSEQNYNIWSSAIAAAQDSDGDGQITYHIYGKVTLDEHKIDGSASIINIVGQTGDAELTVTTQNPTDNGIVYVVNNNIKSVNFINLNLSRPDGEWRGNEGHHNRFFTVWDSDGSTELIAYDGCTFLNGSGNNQYGKTTYTGCTFYNDVYYALWIYGSGNAGIAEVTDCYFEADRGVKIYSEDSSATVKTTIKNSEFVIESKPAIVSSIAGELTIENVDADKCDYGLLASEPWEGKTDLAHASVTVDGNEPDFVASVVKSNGGVMYTTSVDFAQAEAKVKVGNTYYPSLQEAIIAAAPAGTVDILGDLTVDKWIMFAENLGSSNGNPSTLHIDGLTINGNYHNLTINSIESLGNGNYLFYDAVNLTINDLTIKYAEGVSGGGIGLQSGLLKNVVFEGGVYGVLPGTGNVNIEECTFKTQKGTSIYFEKERDGLTVTGCTFENENDANVILLHGDVTFTNNIVISGRTVNVVSGSPTVSGNDFGGVRFKVYSDATATITNNEINNLAFEDGATDVASTFVDNTLSEEANTVLNGMEMSTITFIDGENIISTITQKSGTTVTAPADPTKEGFNFVKWDPEIPTTMPEEDLIIRAIWDAIQPPTDDDDNPTIPPTDDDDNPIVPPTQPSYTGGGTDTGSGNYNEYPRQADGKAGTIFFGTSKIVKSVDLPAGVTGEVKLIAKSENPGPDGKDLHHVFEINIPNYPTGEKATINFELTLAELEAKGLTAADIGLYHFDKETGVWTKLPTTYKVVDGKVYFESVTTGFSPFAIVFEEGAATPAAGEDEPVTPPTETPDVPNTPGTVPPADEPQDEPETPASPAPILAVLAGLGAVAALRRK